MFKVMRNGLELRRGIYQYATPSVRCYKPQAYLPLITQLNQARAWQDDSHYRHNCSCFVSVAEFMSVDRPSTEIEWFSFPPGPLMDVIGRFLEERSMGTLAEQSPNFHKMGKVFKGAQINVSKPERQKNATRTIKGFVSSGGLLRFDSPSGSVTVEVGGSDQYSWFTSLTPFLLATLSCGTRIPVNLSSCTGCCCEESTQPLCRTNGALHDSREPDIQEEASG